MKILSLVSIPEFITLYALKDESIYSGAYELSDCIISLDYDCMVNSNELIYKYKIPSNDIVKRFVDFYIDKSKLNNDYSCKYEDELELPKSLENEAFIFYNGNKYIKMYIESYDGEILSMSCFE